MRMRHKLDEEENNAQLAGMTRTPYPKGNPLLLNLGNESMTQPAKPNFRTLLAAHKPVYSAWLGLGSPLAVEIAADAGWHAAMIDQQHGTGGDAELAACLTAAKAAVAMRTAIASARSSSFPNFGHDRMSCSSCG